jgi:hypothetical protein
MKKGITTVKKRKSGPIPDKTLELKLVPNRGGRTEETRKRLLIDLTGFCQTCGAYVIRFESRLIARLQGSSAILKIGQTRDGFLNRFTNYNHQTALTCAPITLSQALVDGRAQPTNAYLMYMLPCLLKWDRVFVDFYFAADGVSTTEIEKQLLWAYLNTHLEAPPLNLSKR